ncbi:MAG: hypothetical protein GY882_12175 [Actinomycetia bacterium]|nr:hypothetical protein [Actinomycetes bacterium]
MNDQAQEQPVDEVTSLVDAPQPDRDDAQQRAHLCATDIQEILERHRCRIMPRIDPATIEPVGLAGDKVQIQATFWIAPLSS